MNKRFVRLNRRELSFTRFCVYNVYGEPVTNTVYSSTHLTKLLEETGLKQLNLF